MKLTIDGQQKAWDYDEGLTLQHVLIDVQQRLLTEESKVVTEIKLDETIPDLDMNLTPEQVTIDKIVSLSFVTTPYNDTLVMNLESAHEKLTTFRDSLPGIIENIIGDKIDTAMNELKDGVDTMIWFFNIVQQANACKVIDVALIKLGDATLFDFIKKFNGMLNELVYAMKNNDMTLINDYLEYELEPALNDIINALPQMISMSKGALD